jgi:hypothetical protein
MQCSYLEPCILQIGQSKLKPIINYTHAFEKNTARAADTHIPEATQAVGT